MPEATVTIEPRTATPAADDVLTVTGTVTIEFGGDTYSCDVGATGWVSATRQHYPPDAYTESDQGLQLVEGAQARPMTAAEVQDYCGQLLLDAFVAATPLTKQTASNLLETGGTAAPEPVPEPTATPTQDPEVAAPPPPQAPPAVAAGEGAPPMEGGPPRPAPPM